MTDRTEELRNEIDDLKAELLPYSNHVIKKNPHRIQWIHQRIGWLYGCLDGRQEMRDEIREWYGNKIHPAGRERTAYNCKQSVDAKRLKGIKADSLRRDSQLWV